VNIWWICQDAALPSAVGDAQHVAIGQHLVRRGHSVTILAARPHGLGGTDLQFRLPDPHSGNEIRQYVEDILFLWLRAGHPNGASPRRMRDSLAFAAEVKRCARRWQGPPPQVVLGSSPPLASARAARRVAEHFHTPFLLDMRGPWPSAGPAPSLLQRRVAHYIHGLERAILRSAHRVLIAEPDLRDECAERGADPAKIFTLPYGVDLQRSQPPTPPTDRSPLVAVCFTAPGPGNSLDPMLDAAAQLQQSGHADLVRFRFYGHSAVTANSFEKTRHPRRQGVVFEQALPVSELGAVLLGADFLLFSAVDGRAFAPSPNIGVVYESMAAGRPVIDASGARNSPIAASGAGITVPPQDPQLLSEAVLALCALSPSARWKMGLRGRQFICEHHDAARLAKDFETVLLEAVESGVRPA